MKFLYLLLAIAFASLALIAGIREGFTASADTTCSECPSTTDKIDGLSTTVQGLTTEVAALKAQTDEVVKETKENIQTASDGLSNLGK